MQRGLLQHVPRQGEHAQYPSTAAAAPRLHVEKRCGMHNTWNSMCLSMCTCQLRHVEATA